jgi:hypothetical protein
MPIDRAAWVAAEMAVDGRVDQRCLLLDNVYSESGDALLEQSQKLFLLRLRCTDAPHADILLRRFCADLYRAKRASVLFRT